MKTGSSFARVALVAGVVLALVACSSSDSSTPPPPVNDAGDDVTSGTTSDAGGSDSPSDAPSDFSSDAPAPSSDGSPEAAADGGSPPCSSLPGTIVYIESGDTQQALLKRLGRQLRDTANITIVYWLTGSCTLTPNLYEGNPIAAGQLMNYIPSTAENSSWTPANAESTCTITTATAPGLGISALYPASCQLGGPEAGSSVGLIDGPIQAYTFIVPPGQFTSDGMAIYAEEAHAAFGAHKGTGQLTWNGTAEWNDPTQMFFRPTTKSTLVSTAFNIQLTASVMAQGAVQEASSSLVLSAVAAATSQNAIGILGDEVYDTQGRGHVNVLAFKAFGQNHAYFPDSTSTAFDKQNIRDGHYSMWSPTVYITAVDNLGVPTNPAIKYITDTVTGSASATPPDGGTPIDGLADITAVGLTPGCAMQVTRATPVDGTAITAAATPPSCTCYFLSKIPGATGTPANCTTCTSIGDCTASGRTCIRGFCEGPGAGVPPAPADGGAGCDTTALNGCTSAQAVDKSGIVYGDAGP
jgi:hypothetical protein